MCNYKMGQCRINHFSVMRVWNMLDIQQIGRNCTALGISLASAKKSLALLTFPGWTLCATEREEPNQSHPGQLDSEGLIPLRCSCLNQHCERTQKGKQNGWKGSASQQRVSSWWGRKSEAAVITDRRGLQQGGDVWTTSRAWQQLSASSRRECVLRLPSMHSVLPPLARPP